MAVSAEIEQSIRDYCLPDALKKEASMWVGRAWSTVFAVMTAGFFFGGFIVSVVMQWLFDVPKETAAKWAEIISVYPSSVFLAFAIMGFMMNKENGVMTLNHLEMQQVEAPDGIWNNLGTVGRALLVVFGLLAALGLLTLIIAIIF